MKRTLLLAMLITITLFACKKNKDDNPAPTTPTVNPIKVSVSITNQITYLGNWEYINNITFCYMDGLASDTNNVTNILGPIHKDSTITTDVTFNKSGKYKCWANVAHAGFIPTCPFQYVTVLPDGSPIHVHFKDALQ